MAQATIDKVGTSTSLPDVATALTSLGKPGSKLKKGQNITKHLDIPIDHYKSPRFPLIITKLHDIPFSVAGSILRPTA